MHSWPYNPATWCNPLLLDLHNNLVMESTAWCAIEMGGGGGGGGVGGGGGRPIV